MHNLRKMRQTTPILNKEVRTMNDKANKCIACSVTQCSNHSCCEDYCTLDKIQVGTHEIDPTKKQCTDCQSFRLK